jgi:hypothetical protein
MPLADAATVQYFPLRSLASPSCMTVAKDGRDFAGKGAARRRGRGGVHRE